LGKKRKEGDSNSAEAYFQVGYKSTGEYGTTKNKVIKKSYVRLQEGSYDSDRVYDNAWGTDMRRAYKSRLNLPFVACIANWNFVQ